MIQGGGFLVAHVHRHAERGQFVLAQHFRRQRQKDPFLEIGVLEILLRQAGGDGVLDATKGKPGFMNNPGPAYAFRSAEVA